MRRYSVFIVILALAAGVGGCAGKQQEAPVSETRILLDTYCTLTVYGTIDPALLEEAFSLCAEYEAMLSMRLEGSDVWRINHAGGAAVTVAPETIEVIKAGLVFGGLSAGLFDITIGRVSTLWDFTNDPHVPSRTELEQARATVDYRDVVVDGDTVRLKSDEAWLDLGGIAKGYIADRLAAFLKERGVTGAVVDLGGDVAIVGAKPDGSPWLIGVRRPFGARNELLGIIEAGEASVVSSGIYERQFIEDGVIYHHILYPNTGMPAETDVVGATLVAENSAAGDALSTMALLVGSDRAPDLLGAAPGFIGALLMLENGELVQIGDINFRLLE